jgi:hypothetical protein
LELILNPTRSGTAAETTVLELIYRLIDRPKAATFERPKLVYFVEELGYSLGIEES